MDDLYELAKQMFVHGLAAEISKQGYVPRPGAELDRVADRAIECAEVFLKRWEQRVK